jgi:hypothetical protein
VTVGATFIPYATAERTYLPAWLKVAVGHTTERKTLVAERATRVVNASSGNLPPSLLD